MAKNKEVRFAVGDRVRSDDGAWGTIKEVRRTILIVRVKGLDEEWDHSVVTKVVR